MRAAFASTRSASRGSLVVSGAIPLLFLHTAFQPSVSISLHGTHVDAYLSDFAVLAVVVAALVAAGHRPGALRRGLPLWIASVAFFAWLAFELAWGRHVASSYALSAHATTAAKFLEYALLAPATVLLVRRRDDVVLVLWTMVGWSCVATVVGIAQFFGSHIAGGKGNAGHRQTSFLSDADFAALSTAVLLVGVVAYALPRLELPRPLAVLALASGTVGAALAAAVASLLGVATALVVLAAFALRRELVPLRRALVVVLVALVAAGGIVAMRSSDLSAFARFVGASTQSRGRQANIQTYSQHTLLAWIGYRIWRSHPLLGVGWEGSAEPADFLPVIPAAHRRFPTAAPQAFPSASPDRRYGVQNVWVQALADLGVIGFVLWVSVFATAALLALRRRLTPAGIVGLAWIALTVWLWASQGFVAGIPLDALTWLGFGLAASFPGPA